MASICISSLSLGFASPSHCRTRKVMTRFQAKIYSTQSTTATTKAPIVRRSGNYPPPIWSYDYLQKLTNNYVDENYQITSRNLRGRVRTMISVDTAVKNPLSALELVDDLQRLGISYHFKEDISSVLKKIYISYFEAREKWKTLDLNLKALGFRLLRQHGYHIPQEIFEDIKDERGSFKAHVHEDVTGVLNLYEASFHALEDENILDEAREFTTKCLKEKLEKNNIVNQSLSALVSHALELPLFWRPQRFEAIWFIEAYKGRSDMTSLLSNFAELDFNILQGIHQEELKFSSRWWDDLSWDKKLSFARDRLVESVMWSIGSTYEPQHGLQRRHLTKLINLINVVDDCYDVYGTLDELEQFTEVVRRWDVNDVVGLPDYMKICFIGLYNTVNEMAYSALTKQETFVIPYLKKVWTDYCEANLVEAQWFNSGYTPTLEEYLNNSCITVSVPLIVSSLHFLTSSDCTEETLKKLIYCTSMILRLADDLGTSSAELKRGDIPKSIQCHMHETGASEEEARAYIRNSIVETWKKLNKERMATHSPSSHILIECATNLVRVAQFTYQRGDNVGSPDDSYKSNVISLLFNPKH